MSTDIGYTLGIPASNNSPSVDQPTMTTNATALSNIWNVDHIGFNQNFSGEHQYVRFPSISASLPAPTGNASYIAPFPGSASSFPQAGFVNANGGVFLSLIRAFGLFGVSGVSVTSLNSNNVTFAYDGVGEYTGTLATNITATENYAIFINHNATGSGTLGISSYTISSTTTFTIFFRTVSNVGFDPINFSVQVLQL